MAQLMPLPLTVSCFSKIQTGFTFLVPAHPDIPGQKTIKRVCVCVCSSRNLLKFRAILKTYIVFLINLEYAKSTRNIYVLSIY